MASTEERLQDLRNRKSRSEMGGGQDRIHRQHSKGKMTARERIEVLLRIPNLVSVDLRNNPLSEVLDVFEKLNQSNIRVDY